MAREKLAKRGEFVVRLGGYWLQGDEREGIGWGPRSCARRFGSEREARKLAPEGGWRVVEGCETAVSHPGAG